MEFRQAGLTGILCVFGDAIDEALNDRVAGLDRALREAQPRWLIETLPAYASLLVRYDPCRASRARVCRALARLEKRGSAARASGSVTVDIPVCYGGEYGPDLPFVAQHAGMTEEEVIRLHSGTVYRIYMLGFLPGFPYLGGLDGRLETPRLSTPRTLIPAGSVGIGGKQTGIYPIASPGGWQLIGRTPRRLFDPSRPLPYRAGDRIRFVPITPKEFREQEAAYER